MYFLFVIPTVLCCRYSQSETGECIATKDMAFDFCADYVDDSVCVQDSSILPEFSPESKDSYIKIATADYFQQRLADELSGASSPVFTRSTSCISSYFNLMCKLNFLKCENETSYFPTSSDCDMLINECSLETDPCGSIREEYKLIQDQSYGERTGVILFLLFLNCFC